MGRLRTSMTTPPSPLETSRKGRVVTEVRRCGRSPGGERRRAPTGRSRCRRSTDAPRRWSRCRAPRGS
ncbi:hypothetical protein ACFPRL_17965 [Pseudoclavibacter helvolus]